jgi:cysteine synthase
MGGTITGVAKVLKQRKPEFKAAVPKATQWTVSIAQLILSGGCPGLHKIQGIGAGFVPPVLRTDLIDEVIPISDKDAIAFSRRMAREEG